jgi:hypothetical protein
LTNVSVTSAWDITDPAVASSTTLPNLSYVTGDTSSLVLFLHPLVGGFSYQGGLFHIERRRYVDGTPAPYGFMVQWLTGGGGVGAQTTKFQTVLTHGVYAQPPVSGTGYCVFGVGASWPGGGSGLRNGVVPAYPVLTGAYPEQGAPSLWMLGTFRNDVPLGQTFQAIHYGTAHTFMSVGNTWLYNSTASNAYSLGNLGQLVPAVRID